MKKISLNTIIILITSIILINVLLNRELIFNTISFSLNIWVKNIIPSLFPFFVLSDILINYGIIKYVPNCIKKTFSKLFNIKEDCLVIFLLSMLSGFPSNARNTKNMYQKGIITKEEAEHILIFTHFSNPLFILGTVAIFFLNNKTYGLIILISHYLSNIILGIILRNKSSYSPSNHYNTFSPNRQNFGIVLSKSIKSSIDTLLMILGTLTCFLIISTLIIHNLNLNNYNSTLIKGILEITMGLKDLSLLNINDIYKVVISSMFLSFGGLSVHMQVISELSDTDISYKPFIFGRFFHAIIAGLISIFLFRIII